MKKILSIFTAVAILTLLTACSNADETLDNNGSGTILQNPETSSDNNSEDLESSENPENSGISEKSLKEMIDAFEMDDLPAPDGEILKKADAVDAVMNGDLVCAVTYDFAYMRKVQPIFVNTLDDPSAFDWDNMEFK